MLTAAWTPPARVLAHGGQPLAPHDAWGAWDLDPIVVALLAVVVWAYRRGRSSSRGPGDRHRDRLFGAGMAVLAVAVVSPLDGLSGTLLSVHMVQHVLLLLVVAPLLAAAAPSSRLLRGSPPTVRRTMMVARRVLRPVTRRRAWWGAAAAAWLAHVLAVWTWHAAVAYEAALASPWLHLLEHASFVVTGVLLWRVVLGGRSGPDRVSGGVAVLVVFATAMQGVFLSALLTFADRPWYATYDPTTAWGLTPLADQHLAGVIMWIPGSVVYLGVALALLVSWLRGLDESSGSGPNTSDRDEATIVAS